MTPVKSLPRAIHTPVRHDTTVFVNADRHAMIVYSTFRLHIRWKRFPGEIPIATALPPRAND